MKAVFFDFDGTLTYKNSNIWKEIWKRCGYDTSRDSYYSKLYSSFISKNITHQQWCDLTCNEFVKAHFTKSDLDDLVDNIQLIDGLSETLSALKENGYSIHIVSGSIDACIDRLLGDNKKYFDSINCNNMVFDENGYLCGIKGTNYDFEGKAKFIEEFKQQTNAKASDLVFVGNGDNDEWAHLAGCKTICINPENTDSNDTKKWHTSIDGVSNLTAILPLLEINTQSQDCTDSQM